MTDLLDDTTLLAALGEVLAPAPAVPDADAMAALHRALDDRGAGAVAFATGRARPAPVPPPVSSARWGQRGGRIHRLRHPVAAAVAVAVLATGGVAAAGVATDHLPGPTRAVAFDLGLPVTSPALATAQGTLAQLDAALTAGDATRVRATADVLRTELTALSPSDRATIQVLAAAALARADTLLATPTTVTPGTGPAAGDPSTGPGATTGGTGSAPAGTRGTGTSSAGGSHPGGSTSTASASGTAATTPTTAPRSDDGSGGTTPGSDDGSGDGSEDGSGSTTPTTGPGSSPTTTQPRVPDDGGPDDGPSDDGSGSTDNAIMATRSDVPTGGTGT